jgi:hypothetical protein
MSMKNSNDTIGKRTRNLPACSEVPQPTAPPRVAYKDILIQNLRQIYVDSYKNLSGLTPYITRVVNLDGNANMNTRTLLRGSFMATS